MPDRIITECPACHARFRVTEGQLKLAAGQVRCGACLQVFDALTEAHRLQHRQHRQEPVQFVPQAGPAPTAAPTTAPTATPPPTEAGTTPSAAAPAPDTAPSADSSEASNDHSTPRPEPAPAQPSISPLPPLTARQYELIPELHAEPLLLDITEEPDDPVATTGWLLASLFALLALGLQYLWFERASLAHDPRLHPFYVLACEHLPCQLRATVPSTLVNEELIVRPHPQFDDALRVDLKLRNTAAFAQPFPALSLNFSDLRGRRLAERVLTPQQYLPRSSPDDWGYDPLRMPPATPIELQLEITDPGPAAVSYSLQILPPQTRPPQP